MLVRLFAVLLAVGMLVISTHGPSCDDLATPDAAAFVDDVDDVPAIAMIESPAVLPDQPSVQSVLPIAVAPVGHRPEIMIFRPPRAAAFV